MCMIGKFAALILFTGHFRIACPAKTFFGMAYTLLKSSLANPFLFFFSFNSLQHTILTIQLMRLARKYATFCEKNDDVVG